MQQVGHVEVDLLVGVRLVAGVDARLEEGVEHEEEEGLAFLAFQVGVLGLVTHAGLLVGGRVERFPPLARWEALDTFFVHYSLLKGVGQSPGRWSSGTG